VRRSSFCATSVRSSVRHRCWCRTPASDRRRSVSRTARRQHPRSGRRDGRRVGEADERDAIDGVQLLAQEVADFEVAREADGWMSRAFA
jgi:hypothetical protein